MKKQESFAIAEQMYVSEQATIDYIATRLNLAEKTVRNWKAQGGWDGKREQLLKTKTTFHDELYGFARKLMRVIQNDMDRMLDPSSADDPERDGRIESRVNSMTRLLDKLPKTKDYEAGVVADKRAEQSTADREKNGLSEEALKRIEAQTKMM